MTTLSLAEKKWERKMANAGTKWKSGVSGKVDEWARGLANFLGISDISTEKKSAWSEGINSVTAEDFSSAVRGKADKWARKLKEAFE